MATRRLLSMGLLGALTGVSCGRNSLVSCPGETSKKGKGLLRVCVQKTADERAVLALNSGDFDLAISLLASLVEAEPEAYFRYPRLAVAYASKAGLDLLNAINITQGGDEGGALGGLGAFIPALDPGDREGYRAKIDQIEIAKDLLGEGMPAVERVGSEVRFYGASAELQLFLYRASFSAMMMNYYAVPMDPSSKVLDENVLKELTADQALIILENLKQTVAEAGQGQGDGQLAKSAASIDAALAKIEAEPGADDSEKLQNYLRRTHGS